MVPAGRHGAGIPDNFKIASSLESRNSAFMDGNPSDPRASADAEKDLRTVLIPDGDATMLVGDPSVARPSAPVRGGDVGFGDVPAKQGAPVTLPEESYAVGGEIARGGMGSILEAEDRKLGRKVAMKVMRLETDATEDQRQRFVREATVLARLEHPNVVPIHELGRDAEGRLFYTMKLVQGRTLHAILDGLKARDADFTRHYTLDRLLTIFRKICDALSMAHAKGVIHRDLKPENVMVGEFGEVLVMDWGIAKQLGIADCGLRNEDAAAPDDPCHSIPRALAEMAEQSAIRDSQSAMNVTLDGMVMGTPHYMSPEQAAGHVSEIDQQSDVFSLGAILYALLTLHPPVEASSIREVLERIKRGDIRPPTEYNAPMKAGGTGQSLAGAAANPKQFQPLTHCPGGKVPPALSAVTMRALTVDKARRYATVAAFAADIEKYQSGFATSAENAGALTQFLLLAKRHKGVTAMLGVLLLASVAFVIKVMASERKATRNAGIAAANEQKATRNADLAAKNAEIAQANEKRAEDKEREAVAEKENVRRSLAKAALNLAEAARREGNGPEMQAALAEVPEDLRDSTYAYLLDQADSSIARLSSPGDEIDSVAADPRRPGVFAIAYRSNKIILLDVRTGAHLLEFAPVFPPKFTSPMRLAFSPDGERIAVGRLGADRIVFHSARDGTKLLEWDAPGTAQLEFSPDGKLLLQTGGGSNLLTAWDTVTGQPRWRYEGHLPRASESFTPDSQQVVIYRHLALSLMKTEDGSLVRQLSKEDLGAYAVSPVSRMLVTGDFSRGKIRGEMLHDGKATFEVQAYNRGVVIRHIAFTPDGARFVSVAVLPDGRQAIKLWDATTGAPLQTLLGGSGGIGGASVHPLSGELIVAGPNARSWSLTGTPEKWTLRGNFSSAIAFWGSDDVVFVSVMTASGGPSPVLQKLQAGTPELLWKPPTGGYSRTSVSADGRFAAVGHVDDNAAPREVFLLRNPGAHTEQAAVFQQTGGFTQLRLSPTGDRLAAITRNRTAVALYDPVTGKQPVKLVPKSKDMTKFWDLGWLSGGKQLVGLVTEKAGRGNPGSEECIVLWDAATGKIVQTATNRTAMDVLAVAPDGRRFAEAGTDKMVRIRDAATLAVQQEFRAHDGPITALAWHPTKPIVATGSADLSVKLWNIETGRRLEEFRGMLTPPNSLAFSPSGQRLGCTGTFDSTRIWDPPSLNDQIADGWEDLLAPLTPAALKLTGNGWRMQNGALFNSGGKTSTLPLPGNLAGTSYQVRVKLRELGSKTGIHVVLPVADRMVSFELDGGKEDRRYTGLTQVNGKMADAVPGSLHGKQVQDSDPHDLQVTVRLDGENVTLTTTLDGGPLYEWTGPTAALSQHADWATTEPGVLALGTSAGRWMVSEVKVKRL